MARRDLTQEEIDKIAEKQWRQTPIFTSDEKLAQRAKNLKGPQTLEGKKRSLANLKVGKNKGDLSNMSHGGYIMRLLDEDEQEMYQQFKDEFLKDYDINESADETILELILIDKIRLFRVMKAQFQNPSMDVDRPLTEISNRLNKNLDSLGALRKQRLKQDDKVHAISIATIAQQFSREIAGGGIQQMLEQQRAEEKAFLEEKERRERAKQSFDAQYEIVEEDEDNGTE